MTFNRSYFELATIGLTSGKYVFSWGDLGGSLSDPFIFITFEIISDVDCATYDYEIEEYTGVGVVKFLHKNGVVSRKYFLDRITATELLVMTDTILPKEYLYPDITNITYPTEPETSKSGRNELNYPPPDSGLPLMVELPFFTTIDVPSAVMTSIPRYAIKPNHHFFSNCILCDTVEIHVRPVVRSGLLMTVHSFL